MDAFFEHIGWMEFEYIDVVFLFCRVDRGVPGSWMSPLDLGDGILLYLFYWFLSSIQRTVFECGSTIILSWCSNFGLSSVSFDLMISCDDGFELVFNHGVG